MRTEKLTADEHPLIDDLYRSEAKSLRQFLMAKLADPRDVDEVLQEAYLRLCKVEARSEIRNPQGLLYRIATNLVIDRYRIPKRQTVHMNGDQDGPYVELSSEAPSPEDRSMVNQQLRVLKGVIVNLPPRCRQVFIMHRIKQMTHSEISRTLGISTQMVEKHIAKALLRCRQRLAEYR